MCVISYKAESEYILLVTGGPMLAEIVLEISTRFPNDF